MEVGTQEFRHEGIPDTSLKASFLPNLPSGECEVLRAEVWLRENRLRKPCVHHGPGAVVYHGLCVLYRQLCLEADSWGPWDPNRVLRVLEGSVSKQKNSHHLPSAPGQDRETHSCQFREGMFWIFISLSEPSTYWEIYNWQFKPEMNEKYKKREVS